MGSDRRYVSSVGEGELHIPAAFRGEALGHSLHVSGQYTYCARCGVFSSERGCKLLEVCLGAPANPTASYRLSLLSRARNPYSVKLAV
eukprot:5314487-Pyramimonas_sp.AAC.1